MELEHSPALENAWPAHGSDPTEPPRLQEPMSSRLDRSIQTHPSMTKERTRSNSCPSRQRQSHAVQSPAIALWWARATRSAKLYSPELYYESGSSAHSVADAQSDVHHRSRAAVAPPQPVLGTRSPSRSS